MSSETLGPDALKIACAKQAARDAKIPVEWRISPELLQRIPTILARAKEGTSDTRAACSRSESVPLQSLEQLGRLLPVPVANKDAPVLDVRPLPFLPADKLPAELRAWLSPEEASLVRKNDATALCQLIHSGQVTSRQVTTAFCKMAALAHQLTNCLTEIFFDEALRAADAADEYLARNGRPMGPLAGLPVSLKDNFKVSGYDTTVGFLAWANDPQPDPSSEEESTLVHLLRAQGAVLYAKTNVPTAMMIAESLNNVFGRSLNPCNLATTCGGSSGGEGALIAFRGSPLGVGTDMAGLSVCECPPHDSAASLLTVSSFDP